MAYLSSTSILNVDGQKCTLGRDPFWEGSCSLRSCCQSSIWCITTICDRLFFIVTNYNREARIKPPSQQSWKTCISHPIFCNYSKNKWKNLTQINNKANITQIDSFYSRNTFCKNKQRKSMKNNLSHIFCWSNTRIDSNLNKPKLRVLTLRSRILMFNSKIIYYTSTCIKF